jgi:hypothetical protein
VAGAAWLIRYRHTLLKLLPFAVLGITWIAHRERRPALRHLAWPHGAAGLTLFVVVILAWSLSTAKHFGSYDAQRALLWPDRHLMRVRVLPRGGAPVPDGDPLYLLHASETSLTLWDAAGHVYGSGRALRVLVLPRARFDWVESLRRPELQPGGQYL